MTVKRKTQIYTKNIEDHLLARLKTKFDTVWLGIHKLHLTVGRWRWGWEVPQYDVITGIFLSLLLLSGENFLTYLKKHTVKNP